MADEKAAIRLVAYIDRQLDQQGVQAVEAQLLRDAELRGLFSMLLRQRIHLRRILVGEAAAEQEAEAVGEVAAVAEPAPAASADESPGDFPEDLPQDAPAGQPGSGDPPTAATVRRTTRAHRRGKAKAPAPPAVKILRLAWPWVGYVLAMLFAGLWLAGGDAAPVEERDEDPFAAAREHPGLPTVVAGGEDEELPAGLSADERLPLQRQVGLAEGIVQLIYDDDSAVAFSGPGQLIVSGSWQLTLNGGSLAAEIGRQSDRRFRILTPFGEIATRGASVTASLDAETGLRVAVSEGTAVVWAGERAGFRLGPDERIEVNKGGYRRLLRGTVEELSFGPRPSLVVKTATDQRSFTPRQLGGVAGAPVVPDAQVIEQLKGLSEGQKVDVQWLHDGERARVLAVSPVP